MLIIIYKHAFRITFQNVYKQFKKQKNNISNIIFLIQNKKKTHLFFKKSQQSRKTMKKR